MKLEANIIGRILGVTEIFIENDSLYKQDRNGNLEEYNLKGMKHFAVLKEGLLGGRIYLEHNGKQLRFRFLKKKKAQNFIKALNNQITFHVDKYLSGVISRFKDFVVKQFPRDSWIHELSELCSELDKNLHSQREEWQEYLSEEKINAASKLAEFHPVNPTQLRKYHEDHQLAARDSFFNTVESNPLTHEQRLGVLRSNDRNMVLAAAGTGKTSVIVAKALDLIDRKLAKPSEILILAYNKAAATELQERLEDKAKKANIALEVPPQISTFHALGRSLLREAKISTNMSVFTEDSLRLTQWVTKWIHDYISENPTRIFDLIELSNPPINPFDFSSKAEYERYIRDNEFRTLNNEKVKGYQELLIANFLYINQVPYKYEDAYVSKRRIDIGFDYKPDFFLTEAKVYIEHFGIDREGKTRADIDSTEYNNSILKKRALHTECGTNLIETFHYEWCDDTLLSGLKSKLEKYHVHCNPMPAEEIFKKLNGQEKLSSWSDLMTKALQAMRVERLDKEGVLNRLNLANIHQPRKFAALLDSLHQGYVNELKQQNSIDFDDMIIRAIHVINENKYVPQWKYILVDEFQDISAARMEFIQAIVEKGPQPSMTVVGDDWQSIYRFSGGKLELTTRFKELVGPCSITKLQKTFRYNNSIAKTAGQFIMENPEQFKKEIKTHTVVNNPQVFLLDDKVNSDDGLYERVKEVVRKIRENDRNGSIAIIARYNYLLNDTRNLLKKAKISKNLFYWSFHKSKGLEADYAILIGFFQGKNGFPNENRDDAIIEALLPSLDAYPHSEERRLMYVGITRAKKKCYVIANPTSPSEFITELLAPKYEINIASKSFQEQFRKTFKCPNCEEGYFRLIKGKYGDFYSCSTGLGCSVSKARVCSKCSAPSVDSRHASICNNISCGHSMKICDKCGRPMKQRQGKYGEFLGCTGYGIKNDQCNNTKKL